MMDFQFWRKISFTKIKKHITSQSEIILGLSKSVPPKHKPHKMRRRVEELKKGFDEEVKSDFEEKKQKITEKINNEIAIKGIAYSSVKFPPSK